MSTVVLQPVDWTLVTEEDAALLDAAASSGDVSFEGFRHAASAQLVHFPPGIVSKSKDVERLLASIGQALPTAGQVQAALAGASRISSMFELEVRGDLWYLRNRSQMGAGSPFEEKSWRFFFKGPGGCHSFGVRGADAVRVLELFPLLNGDFTLEEVARRIYHHEPTRALLAALVRARAVGAAPPSSFSARDLPDLLFLGHSSIAVRDGDDIVVVDPAGVPANVSLAMQDRPLFQILRRAAAIVISHFHWDHLHLQTIVRLPRDKPLLVPRNHGDSFVNPSIARYLRLLGFTCVREFDPWDEVAIGRVRIRFAPFYGEPFGLGSHFDGLTYHVQFGGRTLYGSVDTWRDEVDDMDATFARVSEWGPVDLFFFGASDQRHDPPYVAAKPRHYSNELLERPDLIRYHPNVDDVARWTAVLQPRCLVPYAEFIFDGARRPDVPFADVPRVAPAALDDVARTRKKEAHRRWCKSLRWLSEQTRIPLLALHPLQGVRNPS